MCKPQMIVARALRLASAAEGEEHARAVVGAVVARRDLGFRVEGLGFFADLV